jgi:DnaA-homolog protein
MTLQIPLALSWRSARTLDDFVFADLAQRAMLSDALQRQDGAQILITGAPGSGKSALLHTIRSDPRFSTIDTVLANELPNVRANPNAAWRATENVQHAAGNASAEAWLFHDFNQAFDQRQVWIATASLPVDQLGIGLADLRSRLQQCLQIRLTHLQDDAERSSLLRLHAARFGMDLDEALLAYLQTHVSRDVATLSAWIQRLDQASLARKRKPSISLVRELLAQDSLAQAGA